MFSDFFTLLLLYNTVVCFISVISFDDSPVICTSYYDIIYASEIDIIKIYNTGNLPVGYVLCIRLRY